MKIIDIKNQKEFDIALFEELSQKNTGTIKSPCCRLDGTEHGLCEEEE